MPRCPQCTKALVELSRECPYCKADLDLLVEYVSQLQTGLERAEGLTRAGELGQAVWAYLAVLEVDPDNAVARRQVGQVATAVRQFDRAAPGRRWLTRVRGEEEEDSSGLRLARRLRGALVAIVVCAAFLLGFAWGGHGTETDGKDPQPAAKQDQQRVPTLTGP